MVLLTRDIVVFVLLVELENNAKKVWAEFELKLSGSGSEWRLNSYWRGFENFPTLSKGSSHIGRFHSRGQHLCKFIGTKESVCIKKRVALPQDRFVTPTWPPLHCFGTPIWPPWRHVKTLYSNVPCQMWTRWSNFFLSISRALWSRFASPCKMRARAPFWNVWNAKQRVPRETTGNTKKLKILLGLSIIFFTSSFLSFLQKNGKNWTQFHFVTEHETTLMGSLHLVKQAPLWSLLSPISMGSWVVIPCTPRLIGAAITPV